MESLIIEKALNRRLSIEFHYYNYNKIIFLEKLFNPLIVYSEKKFRYFEINH